MTQLGGFRYEIQTYHITSFDSGVTPLNFWAMIERHTSLHSAQVNLAKYALSTGKRFRIKDRKTGEIL